MAKVLDNFYGQHREFKVLPQFKFFLVRLSLFFSFSFALASFQEAPSWKSPITLVVVSLNCEMEGEAERGLGFRE